MKKFIVASLLLGSALCFYNGITSILAREAYVRPRYRKTATHVIGNGAIFDGTFHCIFGVGLIISAINIWRKMPD